LVVALNVKSMEVIMEMTLGSLFGRMGCLFIKDAVIWLIYSKTKIRMYEFLTFKNIL